MFVVESCSPTQWQWRRDRRACFCVLPIDLEDFGEVAAKTRAIGDHAAELFDLQSSIHDRLISSCVYFGQRAPIHVCRADLQFTSRHQHRDDDDDSRRWRASRRL